MKDFASGKWDAISSIAWSNAKSVWSGTSKWFGNAFSSLKGWVGDMYESTFDKFDSISKDGQMQNPYITVLKLG